MPGPLPDADPVPTSGELPSAALATLPSSPFGIYLHVPFCRTRCGYCDFTTYTADELGAGLWDPPGPDGFVDSLLRELDLAAALLQPTPVVTTIFVGGGTPTLLQPGSLVRVIREVGRRWRLDSDVEVTVEANPDTVTPVLADRLAAAGVTRVSLGVQSVVPRVLATLERTHRPESVAPAVAAIRGAGVQVSVDLIYGTAGESLADWRASLDGACALAPDHVSAYALVVEPGTRLAHEVARGRIGAPDPDDQAAKYELADDVLTRSGFEWYEVSNWATRTASRCRHNLGYWAGGNWWGVGPGAHGHVGGVRWWNVRHPRDYARAVGRGQSPAAGGEVLTDRQRHDEHVLLSIRTRDGLAASQLAPAERARAHDLVGDGLLDATAWHEDGLARLTLRGRLLADLVVRRILVG